MYKKEKRRHKKKYTIERKTDGLINGGRGGSLKTDALFAGPKCLSGFLRRV